LTLRIARSGGSSSRGSLRRLRCLRYAPAALPTPCGPFRRRQVACTRRRLHFASCCTRAPPSSIELGLYSRGIKFAWADGLGQATRRLGRSFLPRGLQPRFAFPAGIPAGKAGVCRATTLRASSPQNQVRLMELPPLVLYASTPELHRLPV